MKDHPNGIIMTFPVKVDKLDGMWINSFFPLQNNCREIAVRDEAAIEAFSFFGNANGTWKSFMTLVMHGNNKDHRDNIVRIVSWKA